MDAGACAELGNQPLVRLAMSRCTGDTSHAKAAGWNERSLLKLLGYTVANRRAETIRRSALNACLVLPDAALPDDQRNFWGGCATRRRARAIVWMIRLFIRLAEARTIGDWGAACQSWRSDVEWAEETWGAGV